MKNKIYMITVIISIIVMSILIIFASVVIKKKYFENEVLAMSSNYQLKEIENNEYNIKNIIEENTKDSITETLEKEERDVEFTTKYVNSSSIATGTYQVLQDGMDGKEIVTTKKKYINGELAEEEIVSTKLVKSSLEKIVQVGTGPSSLKYQINVNDKMYVTSSLLPIYSEADRNSTKIISVNKNEEVTILEISGDFVKVKYGSYKGWAPKDCLTKTNPTKGQGEETKESSKAELASSLSKDMLLNKPSGLSLEQFKKVLTGDSQDKRNVFNDNYQYFYYAEQQYNVNGIFLAAVAIHESAWGTSKMAQNKNNLFGYGAYDSNPSDNAYVFKNVSEGIDLLARVFAKYYLNPKGTVIYNNERASGSHYNGATVAGVNKHYATDTNWSNAVFKWMQYLYGKI